MNSTVKRDQVLEALKVLGLDGSALDTVIITPSRILANGYDGGTRMPTRQEMDVVDSDDDCHGVDCSYQEPHRHGFACDRTCPCLGRRVMDFLPRAG